MSRKIVFTECQIEEILKYRDNGLTYKEIGEMYEVSSATISKAFKENNILSTHPSLTEERKQQICELYKKYGVKEKVIHELHTTYTTVSRVLEEYGIHQNTNGELTRHYTLNETYFDIIDNENKSYFLGLLFADGCCSKHGYSISISLQEEDKYILEKLNSELQSNRELKLKDYSDKGYKKQYCLSITNKHMWTSLVKHGMVPNKSLKLTFPKCVPEHLYKDFVRGYFDGDGHISKNWDSKKVEITSNIDFCNFLQNYLSDRFNVMSKLFHVANKESNTRVLNICRKNSLQIFLNWIYNGANIFLLRKKHIYDTVYYPKFNNALLI